MLDIDVLVDGAKVANLRADGVIISTPTGSTAYNLAANGPIVHPEMDVIIVTPICPHTLTNRPVVLSAEVVVEMRINDGEEMYLTLDGQQGFPLQGGDIVRVWRSERRMCLLVPTGRNYFDVLRNKLQWGIR
jgi:NAD+ kinase